MICLKHAEAVMWTPDSATEDLFLSLFVWTEQIIITQRIPESEPGEATGPGCRNQWEAAEVVNAHLYGS